MKSLNPLLYPVIFKRKSTRKYADQSVSKADLDKLVAFLPEAIPLLPTQKCAFEVQPHKGNQMKIAAYADHEAPDFINLAFMLQQMDLFIQMNGLGAVWNATIRATKKNYQELPYGISLIFGIAKENPLRESESLFSRKQPVEISNTPQHPVINAVRLAPSARNRQPWYLSCTEGQIHFFHKRGGILDNTLLKNLQFFDIGIALCHAALALQQEGATPSATVMPDPPKKEGYTYAISLNY